MFDYLRDFPIPAELLPRRLHDLLTAVGTGHGVRVDVCQTYDHDPHGPNREYLHMLMAAVDDDGQALPFIDNSEGVVAHSVPVLREKGASRNYSPSLDGHDYIIAAWGSGSFYSYNLAEKVWMMLGLTPRCIGNDTQRLVYDDLGVPEIAVAEGEVSGRYHWESSRDIKWSMSNEYLRKYLWMRGKRGVRVFFYEAVVEDRRELRDLMDGEQYVDINQEGGWYSADHTWTTAIDFPTGRICLQAYSPYPDTDWIRNWKEAKGENLTKLIPSIVRELAQGATEIARLVAEAEVRAEAQRREWEVERQKRLKEEAERRAATALKESKADLLQFIARWAEARNIEQFLADVEKDLSKFDPAVRETLSDRLRAARELFDEGSALEHLKRWKTPQERLEE
ncbi:hypothetical protein LJ656_12265 [Paraburkholderia sp. MMS20-SJTR3]|uniref:Uncharacterized protein n=1 Tax=Paraburkholderia sejongensis TaxID=2886946 RepID=A0ABS8JUG9_9BURK|nr:hypothetical protein [Paraburkholderia sp. MMS20-SJTR3]MCC8393369.1 hypothetical protein [Paraburkholderia sp. MMS20-SJTR3]